MTLNHQACDGCSKEGPLRAFLRYTEKGEERLMYCEECHPAVRNSGMDEEDWDDLLKSMDRQYKKV